MSNDTVSTPAPLRRLRGSIASRGAFAALLLGGRLAIGAAGFARRRAR